MNMDRRALNIRPSHLECWRLYAEISGSLGEINEMKKVIAEASKTFDEPQHHKSISMKAYASVYHQLGTSFLSVSMSIARIFCSVYSWI
jgi:hypothetical protein